MNADEYRRMADVEDRMWWYRGLHDVVLAALDRWGPRPLPSLLDAGCGTGGLLRRLERSYRCAPFSGR